MPYRRLPNTDKARLRAMEKALRKCLTDNPTQCPVSENTITWLQTLLPKFQHAQINLEAAKKNQVARNKEYLELIKKARIYLSHFIQVMNFAILRGELKPEIRDFYGLSSHKESLPQLTTEKNILEWGKKLIEGEQKRMQKGGSPIYNPSIALVKVNYEKFADAYTFQKNLISISNRGMKNVNEMRPEVDNLILQIWNEIEIHFMQPDGIPDREKTSEYGIVYILRRREKQNMLKNVQISEHEKVVYTPVVKAKDDINKFLLEEQKEPETVHYVYSTRQTPVQSTINF